MIHTVYILFTLTLTISGFSFGATHLGGDGPTKSIATTDNVVRSGRGGRRSVADGSPQKSGRFNDLIRENIEIQQALSEALPKFQSSDPDSTRSIVDDLRQRLVDAGLPDATESDVRSLIQDFLIEKARNGDMAARELLMQTQKSANDGGQSSSANAASKSDTSSLVRGTNPPNSSNNLQQLAKTPSSGEKTFLPSSNPSRNGEARQTASAGSPETRLLNMVNPSVEPVNNIPSALNNSKPSSLSAQLPKPTAATPAGNQTPLNNNSSATSTPSAKLVLNSDSAPASNRETSRALASESKSNSNKGALSEPPTSAPASVSTSATDSTPAKRTLTASSTTDTKDPKEFLSTLPKTFPVQIPKRVEDTVKNLTPQQAALLKEQYLNFLKTFTGANPPPPLYWIWYLDGRFALEAVLNRIASR